ncbi:MAG: hypothetical protein EZS26_001971 [Candidatus Ordinivivax streblomastigis]|uniref:Uncharacterized protein n=1 Tax=Candidatus Ordinivivax streblomastigis TaxID=2540710 RepID=A0A5M8P097_9BACT|nr:MAG: hypothetical protein EZS26_001971 [Candidatus Ordinivivax streblomastigis]
MKTKPRYFFYQGLCIAIFVLFAGFLTAGYNYDFLFRAEELSLFLPTRLFFLQHLRMAGGLLTYAGTFLTQFFYYPWLGSVLLLLLLLLIQYLTLQAFEIPKRYYPLSFIPSILLLLSVTQVGYVLFSLKSPGYLFSNTLGVLVCLLAVMGYKQLKNEWTSSIAWALFIILGYPLFGFYALFTALICVITPNPKGTYTLKTLFRRLGIICLIVIIPYLYYIYIYTQMQFTQIYVASLPRFYFDMEFYLWLPFILLFLSLVVFSLFFFAKQGNRPNKTAHLIAFCLFAISLFYLYNHSFRDENFQTELKMTKAIEAGDWEKVISIGKKIEGNPTRLIIMDYNLALNKLGKAGDRLFSMNNNSVLQNSKRPNLVLMNTGAKSLYFQYGKTNFCYRWCMEEKVEYGMNVEQLKYMVKSSLVNGEYALAQKYNKLLLKTFFHKSWAMKYQQYIDNHPLIAEDAEFQAIKPLMAYEDLLDGDGNLLEAYILNSFAYMKGGPPELVELSLQCNLILKNIERFWPRFFLYARTHDRIPVHYQEAALLYSYLEKKVDVRNFALDKGIVDRFNQLVAMSQKYEYNSEERNKVLFKPQFGDTFWYYYFFVKDIKTN